MLNKPTKPPTQKILVLRVWNVEIGIYFQCIAVLPCWVQNYTSLTFMFHETLTLLVLNSHPIRMLRCWVGEADMKEIPNKLGWVGARLAPHNPNPLENWGGYISQIGQIHLAIWKNTTCNWQTWKRCPISRTEGSQFFGKLEKIHLTIWTNTWDAQYARLRAHNSDPLGNFL